MNSGRGHAFLYSVLLSLLTIALSAGTLAAQSADEVVTRALDRADRMLEDVQDCTIIRRQESTSGRTTVDTLYLEKEVIEGHAHLVPPGSGPRSRMATACTLAEDLRGFSSYEGTDEVEGHETHVLINEDRESLERWLGTALESELTEQGAVESLQIQEARAYVDAERYVLRKIVVSLEVTREGKTFPVQYEHVNSDFRETEGLLFAHTATTRTLGLTGGMTQQELEEARENLRKAERELEELPPEKRAMAESFMGDRLERWREMLESGTMETVTEVIELRVNEGPHGGGGA